MKQLPTQNLAAYARKMLIDGYIILLDTAEIKAHSAQLQKIGVNINQIAKRINETDYIYADDMNELKELMSEVWKLERRLLLQFKSLVKLGFGILPNKHFATQNTETAIHFLCLLRNSTLYFKGKDGNGMEKKQE